MLAEHFFTRLNNCTHGESLRNHDNQEEKNIASLKAKLEHSSESLYINL